MPFPSYGLNLKIASVVFFCAMLLAASPRQQTIVLRVETRNGVPNRDILSRTASILVIRLRAARTNAAVATVLRGNMVRIKVQGDAPDYLARFLTTPGKVTFKILPNGVVYAPENGVAVKRATVGADIAGRPTVQFMTGDPESFRRFTASHLGKRLGIFVDGKLLVDPSIEGPMSSKGWIGGYRSAAEARLSAAVIGSPPLPARVRILSISH